jgi:uncharacterized YigZ family protein
MGALKESNSDIYSIGRKTSAEIVIKGSKFIGNAAPIADRAGAEQFIQEISSYYRDATHNCFAYRTGVYPKTVFRFSDAGEPSGTAGRPILQAIESKKLTNIVIVVTRYFGGTKLGTGGLIRAYRAAAMAALEAATIVVTHILTSLELRFAYQHANTVHNYIDRFDASIQSTVYGAESIYQVEIASSDAENFTSALSEALSGQIEMTQCK